ncbi:hypothetical protein ILYODFUR_016361 [Ilyodon furcidens]|uniref:Uncharacterized protein n=1 Tax=Ilyodon furcidens TaxID=33524 RepID=A0ABV0TYT7_9TELE
MRMLMSCSHIGPSPPQIMTVRPDKQKDQVADEEMTLRVPQLAGGKSLCWAKKEKQGSPLRGSRLVIPFPGTAPCRRVMLRQREHRGKLHALPHSFRDSLKDPACLAVQPAPASTEGLLNASTSASLSTEGPLNASASTSTEGLPDSSAPASVEGQPDASTSASSGRL